MNFNQIFIILMIKQNHHLDFKNNKKVGIIILKKKLIMQNIPMFLLSNQDHFKKTIFIQQIVLITY